MPIAIIEASLQPHRFFSILPPDWQESIVPYWPDYANTARIFVIETLSEVIGGGIVFSTVSPDTLAYKEEARKWVEAGYLYIGFLWVSQNHRDQKLGSQWLLYVLNHFPNTPFWLTVEEQNLFPFYERNGFKFIKKVELGSHDEWILATRDLE